MAYGPQKYFDFAHRETVDEQAVSTVVIINDWLLNASWSLDLSSGEFVASPSSAQHRT